LYPRFVRNWVDVVWAVAEGRVIDVDVDWAEPYMVELTMCTAETGLMRVIDLPEELVKWDGEGVGFRRVVYKDGKWWYVPGDTVLATVNVKGKDVDECFGKAKEIAQQIKCVFVDVDWKFEDEIKEDLKKLEELGERFKFMVKKG